MAPEAAQLVVLSQGKSVIADTWVGQDSLDSVTMHAPLAVGLGFETVESMTTQLSHIMHPSAGCQGRARPGARMH